VTAVADWHAARFTPVISYVAQRQCTGTDGIAGPWESLEPRNLSEQAREDVMQAAAVTRRLSSLAGRRLFSYRYRIVRRAEAVIEEVIISDAGLL